MKYELFLSTIHPEDREYVDRKWTAALQGEDYDIEHRIIVGDTVKWVRERAKLEFDVERNLKGGFGTVQDITERKKSQEALFESESKLRTLFAAMNDVIIVLDSDGRYLDIPPTNPNRLYKPAPELLGKTLAEVFPSEQADLFLSHIQETLEKQQPVTIEYSLMIGDTEYWFTASISPLTEKSVILVARDITERKRAEERIATLRREQESFMRHEVKNLFAPIQLFAELTLSADNLTEEQSHYLRRIIETASRAAGFMDSLKRLQDIETGKYTLKLSRKSLNTVVRQTIENLEPLAEKSGVSVRFQATGEEMFMHLDPSLFPGVFTNLIKNAIEHVASLSDPLEKRVTVTLSKEPKRYVIRINNKGEPIPPERIATFFDKFNVGPKKRNGTGLGTTYAYMVTKAHGGNITVRSNAEEGTTVTVALPTSIPG
jgi:PAS domain S-box-containing protein